MLSTYHDNHMQFLCQTHGRGVELECTSRNLPYIDLCPPLYSEPSGQFKCFSIISDDVLKEMVEGFSTEAMYLDGMNDKQDRMLDKQDETLDQIKIISSDVKALSENIINTMNSRFERLENDMAMLKAKLAV